MTGVEDLNENASSVATAGAATFVGGVNRVVDTIGVIPRPLGENCHVVACGQSPSQARNFGIGEVSPSGNDPKYTQKNSSIPREDGQKYPTR